MKIVVIGGNGLIGTKLVPMLRKQWHEVLAASRSTGVNTLTGEGLAAALDGANVVVDVANSPSFEDQAVLDFFQTAGRNIHAAEAAAHVGHHVALSVVGTDRLPESGYFRAKLAQENLIKESGIPYTIVRATQFFEFVGAIVDAGSDGQTSRLSPAMMQPIAADDVAEIVADVAVNPPQNTTLDIAGPDRIPMDSIGRQFLAATAASVIHSQAGIQSAVDNPSPRALHLSITTDPNAGYFGSPINDQSLTPIGPARLGLTRFADWLTKH